MNILKTLFFLPVLFCFGSAVAEETYTMEIGQFEKLKVNANVSVIYRNLPDSTGLARYTGDEDISKVFILTNKGKGTLRIQLAQTQWNRKDAPLLYVYSDFLSEVESSSNHTVAILDPAQCASFSVNQIGNGEITVDNLRCTNLTAKITTGNGILSLSGRCENANFRMLGAGQIMADRMPAEDVRCTILGTGSIGCWPIDNLIVKGIGTTKIYYKGHPDIKKTGGGKLFELPSESPAYDETFTELKTFSQSVDEDDDGDDDEDEGEEEDDDDDDDEVLDDDTPTVVTGDD